jgi:hypothetical protein
MLGHLSIYMCVCVCVFIYVCMLCMYVCVCVYVCIYYRIEGISETTGASSDVYCQSNNDDHNGKSCAFYVESIQVKHRGELGREHRERTFKVIFENNENNVHVDFSSF